MPRALLAVLFVVALAGPAPAQQKGRKVAFLVGVGEFKHDLPGLNGSPQKDVGELAKMFRGGGFEVVVLADKDATKAGVEKRYKALLEGDGNPDKSLTNRDVLLVAVCSHGFTLSPGAGKPDAPFLAAHDSKLNKTDTMIPLNALIDEGKSSGATCLFLIDACREVTDVNRGIEGNQTVLPKGISVLFSCGRGQVSHQSERAGNGHGLFTYAVLKAFRGDTGLTGDVSWAEVVGSVQKTFQSAEFKSLIPPAKPQTPVLATGELPFTALLPIDPLAADIRALDRAKKLSEPAGRAFVQQGGAPRVPKWKEQAEAQSPNAMVLYGVCLAEGYGVPKDEAKAVELFRKAADAGSAAGMTNLGTMLDTGRGVRQDQAEAVKWFRKAADAGYPPAMNALGAAYETGEGVAKDAAEAARWFLASADAKYPIAMGNLGLLYARGTGVRHDDKQAVDWFRKAADAGEPTGMTNLGAMYSAGRGVPQDNAEAAKWTTKAAEAGDPRGMSNLGGQYLEGRGVPKDLAAAIGWFRKAAEAGDTKGMFNYGVALANGRTVTKNPVEAVRWYQKAAEKGHVGSMFNLGTILAAGDGVPKDEAGAAKWYEKAANTGAVDAMYNLARMYEAGRGVRKDLAKAVEWYRKAADAGDSDAAAALNRLRRK